MGRLELDGEICSVLALGFSRGLASRLADRRADLADKNSQSAPMEGGMQTHGGVALVV